MEYIVDFKICSLLKVASTTHHISLWKQPYKETSNNENKVRCLDPNELLLFLKQEGEFMKILTKNHVGFISNIWFYQIYLLDDCV